MSTLQQAETENPLGSRPVTGLLLKYAVPSVISMVVMALYNIVDQIFIGRGVGYLGNSATTVAFPLVTVMMSFALLIGNGAAAYISLEMGKGNDDNVKKSVGNVVISLIAVGVILTAMALFLTEPLLRLLGATDAVMPYAIDYVRWIAPGILFVTMTTALTSVIRADGSPRFSMVATLVGAILNTILDPIFIFVFHMGVKGAAIATSISQIVSWILVMIYMLRFAKNTKLTKSSFRFSFPVLRRICGLGSSSFLTQISLTFVNIVLNNSLTYYGARSVYGSEIALAAMGIVMKVNAIMLSCIIGFAIGAQPILGYNFGARNYVRVRKTYTMEIILTAIVSAVAWLIFMLFPQSIISIFGDSSEQFNEFGAICVRVFLSGVIAVGIQIPSSNYFQAVGKPLKAAVLAMTRSIIILIPAMLVLPLFFGLDGILYSGPVADFGALLVTAFFIFREMKHLRRLTQDQDKEKDTESSVVVIEANN